MPVSKFNASQIDLKMIYSSKILSIIINVNFIIKKKIEYNLKT